MSSIWNDPTLDVLSRHLYAWSLTSFAAFRFSKHMDLTATTEDKLYRVWWGGNHHHADIREVARDNDSTWVVLGRPWPSLNAFLDSILIPDTTPVHYHLQQELWAKNGKHFALLELPVELQQAIYVRALGSEVQPHAKVYCKVSGCFGHVWQSQSRSLLAISKGVRDGAVAAVACGSTTVVSHCAQLHQMAAGPQLQLHMVKRLWLKLDDLGLKLLVEGKGVKHTCQKTKETVCECRLVGRSSLRKAMQEMQVVELKVSFPGGSEGQREREAALLRVQKLLGWVKADKTAVMGVSLEEGTILGAGRKIAVVGM